MRYTIVGLIFATLVVVAACYGANERGFLKIDETEQLIGIVG